jgi:integrase
VGHFFPASESQLHYFAIADLRRTFATELRARQVHEYDIADLLGHTIQSVTGTYARSTPEALEDAVNRLTEPRGTVIQFKRKAG